MPKTEQLAILYKELKENKENYHTADKNINEINLKIAELLCPLNIGEQVILNCYNGKIILGIIDKIFYFYSNTADYSMKTINSQPTWCISGKRINKDNSISNRNRFDANPVFWIFDMPSKTFTEHLDPISVMLS